MWKQLLKKKWLLKNTTSFASLLFFHHTLSPTHELYNLLLACAQINPPTRMPLSCASARSNKFCSWDKSQARTRTGEDGDGCDREQRRLKPFEGMRLNREIVERMKGVKEKAWGSGRRRVSARLSEWRRTKRGDCFKSQDKMPRQVQPSYQI